MNLALFPTNYWNMHNFFPIKTNIESLTLLWWKISGKLTNYFWIELTEYDNFKDRIDNLLLTNNCSNFITLLEYSISTTMQPLHMNRLSFWDSRKLQFIQVWDKKMGIFVTQTKLSYLWNGITEVWRFFRGDTSSIF
jgi:hypothetical protein